MSEPRPVVTNILPARQLLISSTTMRRFPVKRSGKTIRCAKRAGVAGADRGFAARTARRVEHEIHRDLAHQAESQLVALLGSITVGR
jgi:hypothetical protein